jgi:hypothetical protein
MEAFGLTLFFFVFFSFSILRQQVFPYYSPAASEASPRTSKIICAKGFLNILSGETDVVWANNPGRVSYDTVVGWYTGPLGIFVALSS